MDDLDYKVKQSKRVIKTAFIKWKPDIGIAFTGRKDSSVMVHLIKTTIKKMPKMVFIDHGYHFPEAMENLDRLIKLWNLDVKFVADDKLLGKLKKEKSTMKKAMILRNLKIKSIESSIRENKWKALITAIRWDENPPRSKEKYFSKRKEHYRVHPLLHFSESDIWEYIRLHKIPYISLYNQGYRSIGDSLSTTKSQIGGYSERGGREREKEQMMEKLRSLGYF